MILASGLAVSNKPFSNEPDNAIHAVLEMCFTEESKFILKALRSTYIPSILFTLIRVGHNYLLLLMPVPNSKHYIKIKEAWCCMPLLVWRS